VWGTGGPEFKSRRSDQKFLNKSRTLGRSSRSSIRRKNGNEGGISLPNTTQTSSETSSVFVCLEQRWNAVVGCKTPPRALGRGRRSTKPTSSATHPDRGIKIGPALSVAPARRATAGATLSQGHMSAAIAATTPSSVDRTCVVDAKPCQPPRMRGVQFKAQRRHSKLSWIEQRPSKLWVTGSNPVGVARNSL
jgi:hypothetical protein